MKISFHKKRGFVKNCYLTKRSEIASNQPIGLINLVLAI